MTSKELYQSTIDWVNENREERSAMFIAFDGSEDYPIISIGLDGNQDYLVSSLASAMGQDSTFRNIVTMALEVLNEYVNMCDSKEN